jgi:hypothetical protein
MICIDLCNVFSCSHVLLLCREEMVARLSGGGLNKEYKLAQLHFHWGLEDDRGLNIS